MRFLLVGMNSSRAFVTDLDTSGRFHSDLAARRGPVGLVEAPGRPHRAGSVEPASFEALDAVDTVEPGE